MRINSWTVDNHPEPANIYNMMLAKMQEEKPYVEAAYEKFSKYCFDLLGLRIATPPTSVTLVGYWFATSEWNTIPNSIMLSLVDRFNEDQMHAENFFTSYGVIMDAARQDDMEFDILGNPVV